MPLCMRAGGCVMTTVTLSISCYRCSRVTTNPTKEHWTVRAEPLVVQGVTLGLCSTCATGNEPPAEGEARKCDGSCSGSYKPASGTYYLAEWGEAYGGKGEAWGCWDLACAEGWLEEQESECGTCGHYVDMCLYEVTDGKRKRVTS